MNVDKVKNMVIILFLLLNVILFVLNQTYNVNYTISESEITDITNYLNTKNINVNTSLIKNFSPLQQLDVLPIEIPQIELGQILLGDITTERIRTTDDLGKDVLKQGNVVLTMENNNFYLDNPDGTGSIELNKESAINLSNKILENFKKYELNLKLDKIYNKDDYFILEYRCKYKNQTFYSSYARFKITKNGITQLKVQLYKPLSFDNNYRNIYSSSEALMSFYDQHKKTYGENYEPVSIEKIDIVYISNELSYNNIVPSKAVPYYRIYISQLNEPIFINAYLSKGNK